MLTLYHRLIGLRRAFPALAVGSYTPLGAHNEVLAYVRVAAGQRLLVVLNLSQHPQRFALTTATGGGQVLLSTHLDRHAEAVHDTLALRGHEGVILQLE